MVRIFNVRFGTFDNVNVVAQNAKAAITEALKLEEGCGQTLHDITDVTLEAEA